MDPKETGKAIAKLRREAGFTQASLAQELYVTDKAVSKWERGLCCPDSALLPRLSALLDCDIEVLLAGLGEGRAHRWNGLLILQENGPDPAAPVYDKPLIHYLFAYFLLAGITDVAVRANQRQREQIRAMQPEQYGLQVSFASRPVGKTLVIDRPFLFFGANLTRRLRSMMAMEQSVIPTADGRELPLLLAHGNRPIGQLRADAVRCAFGRGMVLIPMDTPEGIADAADFVRIYQTRHGLKIADLREIAEKRGMNPETGSAGLR